MNQLTIIGNMGKDPELAYNSAGLPVCKFTVSTHHKQNRDSEPVTTWHNIVVFGDMAENCAETLQKGYRVVVMGRWENRKYEKKDGTTGYAQSIIAEDVAVNLRFHVCEVGRRGKTQQTTQNEPMTDEEPF
jgi:single-strand DNA-binding protein